jgi:hypothetical protein
VEGTTLLVHTVTSGVIAAGTPVHGPGITAGTVVVAAGSAQRDGAGNLNPVTGRPFANTRNFFDPAATGFVFFPYHHDFGVAATGHFSLGYASMALPRVIMHVDLLQTGPAADARGARLAGEFEACLRRLWVVSPGADGKPRAPRDFPAFAHAVAPSDVAAQGRNNHCGALAVLVAQCLARTRTLPTAAAVAAAEAAAVRESGAVRAEDVQPEVGRRIAPHRVRVVGPALRVVPLDQQPRALQPVVVRRARLRGTGPGQVHGVQRGRVGVAPQR